MSAILSRLRVWKVERRCVTVGILGSKCLKRRSGTIRQSPLRLNMTLIAGHTRARGALLGSRRVAGAVLAFHAAHSS